MELCKWQKKYLLGPGCCFCSPISVLLADTFHVSFIFLADSEALGSLRLRLGSLSLRALQERASLAVRILLRAVVKMSSWKQSKSHE